MHWNLFLDELATGLWNGFRQIARHPGFMAFAVLDRLVPTELASP